MTNYIPIVNVTNLKDEELKTIATFWRKRLYEQCDKILYIATENIEEGYIEVLGILSIYNTYYREIAIRGLNEKQLAKNGEHRPSAYDEIFNVVIENINKISLGCSWKDFPDKLKLPIGV